MGSRTFASVFISCFPERFRANVEGSSSAVKNELQSSAKKTNQKDFIAYFRLQTFYVHLDAWHLKFLPLTTTP